jgi:hypothetical protein
MWPPEGGRYNEQGNGHFAGRGAAVLHPCRRDEKRKDG